MTDIFIYCAIVNENGMFATFVKVVHAKVVKLKNWPLFHFFATSGPCFVRIAAKVGVIKSDPILQSWEKWHHLLFIIYSSLQQSHFSKMDCWSITKLNPLIRCLFSHPIFYSWHNELKLWKKSILARLFVSKAKINVFWNFSSGGSPEWRICFQKCWF